MADIFMRVLFVALGIQVLCVCALFYDFVWNTIEYRKWKKRRATLDAAHTQREGE